MARLMLRDILDTEAFGALAARKLLTERAHPDDPSLRIYSYGKEIQYKGLWTPEAIIARGLTLKVGVNADGSPNFSDAEVMGRGLPKFFTIEQENSDWGRVKLVDDDENVTIDEAPEIPMDAPAIVSEKLNGALGLGYIDPSGRFRISTKGSFESLEANVANRVLDEKHEAATVLISRAEAKNPSGKTYLFEVITPERPHPVDYGDLEDVIFLGAVDDMTGDWAPAQGDEEIVRAGFDFAPTMKVDSLREAVALPYRDNTEGFVVTIDSDSGQHMYKVKPSEYLELRRLFYMSQPKDLAEIVSRYSPEEFWAIEKPSDVDLASKLNSAASGQIADVIAKLNGVVFDSFIRPAKELHDSHMSAAEGIMAEYSDVTRGEFAARAKELGAEGYSTRLLFSALSAIESGDSKIKQDSIDLAIKNIRKGS